MKGDEFEVVRTGRPQREPESTELSELDNQILEAQKRKKLQDLDIAIAEGETTKAALEEEAYKAKKRVEIGCTSCEQQQLDNDAQRENNGLVKLDLEETVIRLEAKKEALEEQANSLTAQERRYENKCKKIDEFSEYYKKLIKANKRNKNKYAPPEDYVYPSDLKLYLEEIAELLFDIADIELTEEDLSDKKDYSANTYGVYKKNTFKTEDF